MAKPDHTPDASPADQAQELARLRARVAELEARPVLEPNLTFTDQKELDAGVDEVGKQWWWYRIDLPPSGGLDISINGTKFYHGQQYKIGTETLRSLKEMVHRSWQHEHSIMGSNENFYRRPLERVISGKQ
jgi:hypothetical protein